MGYQVKMSCENRCMLKPNSRIFWKKNGEILPHSQRTSNEEELHNIKMDDEGNYSCALEGHEDHPSPPLMLNVMCEYKGQTK